jgi:hypothetical protein
MDGVMNVVLIQTRVLFATGRTTSRAMGTAEVAVAAFAVGEVRRDDRYQEDGYRQDHRKSHKQNHRQGHRQGYR